MSKQNLDVIENLMKSKGVKDYEIFLVEGTAYESILLKDTVDNERELNDLKYILRILFHKKDKTGIGVIKGNSLNINEIEKSINTCVLIAKNNLGSKFHFPGEVSYPDISILDKKVFQAPLDIKNDLVEELISEINQYKEVDPTFGRFRVHIDKISLRNSNALDISTLKTYFFIEFSLKAQLKGKLSEYWPYLFIKEKNQLDFSKRVEKWVRLAQDSLKAKVPLQNNYATVIFSPRVLKDALNSVIERHASGSAYLQNLSRFETDEEVATNNLSLIDNGLLEGGLKTNKWDSEGSPHQRTEIIKDGIFQKRLYDQKFALLANQSSTGNGMRTLMGAVDNGISNLEILPGTMNLDDIISEINEGYYIEQFSWLNPSKLTGDFGAEIRNGYYIKNGEYENPIKLGNISGNVLKMIKDCQYISKEREYFENTFFPYMVFNNLAVSL